MKIFILSLFFLFSGIGIYAQGSLLQGLYVSNFSEWRGVYIFKGNRFLRIEENDDMLTSIAEGTYRIENNQLSLFFKRTRFPSVNSDSIVYTSSSNHNWDSQYISVRLTRMVGINLAPDYNNFDLYILDNNGKQVGRQYMGNKEGVCDAVFSTDPSTGITPYRLRINTIGFEPKYFLLNPNSNVHNFSILLRPQPEITVCQSIPRDITTRIVDTKNGWIHTEDFLLFRPNHDPHPTAYYEERLSSFFERSPLSKEIVKYFFP